MFIRDLTGLREIKRGIRRIFFIEIACLDTLISSTGPSLIRLCSMQTCGCDQEMPHIIG